MEAAFSGVWEPGGLYGDQAGWNRGKDTLVPVAKATGREFFALQETQRQPGSRLCRPSFL
ncbi:hypothetical protein [Desulfitobacterium hafniense]|uniref:hypothetical protein n=1 Tax=Desulfitobacterium hafniense TaxID=49338 RepID=UPI00035EDB57|nr:hypothetical protein [Desulfitobacterium hafniense]